MDINELESYRLSDAIKFNKQLNPKIWGQGEVMLPKVRENLLTIARDFAEFLGVTDIDIEDITVSGSNAAYTYTPHSDIDLHLVVKFPQNKLDTVYRELFDAKKYQYNDQHNYKIGGYDVELYVQDADQAHHSQGIYSVLDNKWVSVPSRRRARVDDISIKSKFEDLGHRIEQAIESGDQERMAQVSQQVKKIRQAGLASTGEFGPENIAFKLLRNHGLLDRLRQARNQAKDQELSLAERGRSRKTKKWGEFGGMWFPGYGYYTSTQSENPESADDGVNEAPPESSGFDLVRDEFVQDAARYLKLNPVPEIIIQRDPNWSVKNKTFGNFDPGSGSISLAVSGRHTMDVLRTLAHELAHARQEQIKKMPDHAGDTGSPWENQAHAQAGIIMRNWAKKHPDSFEHIDLESVDEGVKSKLAGLATAACVAGTPGCATVAPVVKDIQTIGRTAQTMKGYGAAGAREEALQRIKDELRRRQGQVVPETVNVNEAFDQPYKLKWERGDHGDIDAYAKLDDGNYLSIMFTKERNQDNEEAWVVEFYRNNSQQVTGEGDAMRVFATVLSAIQTFIKKYQPPRLTFSASKEVEPGQNAQSRARLYDSLVQRYARAWGYRAFRADAGNKVMYELSRRQSVSEATGYIPVNDQEARDPRYSMAITPDIRPGEVQRQARKMGFTTTAAGVPPILKSSGKIK